MLGSKRHTIQICGESYTIVSDESEEQIRSSVAMVDTLMREIAGGSVSSSLKKVAVLAALKLSLEMDGLKSELNQVQEAVQNLVGQVEQQTSS